MLKSYTAEIITKEQAIVIEALPPEVVYYQELKAMSHFAALQDNLKLAMQPELRTDYENYITQELIKSNRPGLVPSHLLELPNITITNLYWYLKNAS
ncbi:MAG: hypothetical protein QNJ32_03045 [Xenococcaceae cyanobacterium MO_167.B27]|nr:hypothetical protein [Xenococcaceae cyanobacterium MO_167.B27]